MSKNVSDSLLTGVKPDGQNNANISGFTSVSTAQVTPVEVSNAKSSNIFGFNKGLNKTVNPPRSKITTKSPSTPDATVETLDETSNEPGRVSAQVFVGSGFTLHGIDSARNMSSKINQQPGNSRRPVSRLVAEYDAASNKSKYSKKIVGGVESNSKCAELPKVKMNESNDRPLSKFVLKPDILADSDDDDNIPLASSFNSRKESTNETLNNMKEIQNHNLGEKIYKSTKIILSDQDDSNASDDQECPLCGLALSTEAFTNHIADCVGGWTIGNTSPKKVDASSGVKKKVKIETNLKEKISQQPINVDCFFEASTSSVRRKKLSNCDDSNTLNSIGSRTNDQRITVSDSEDEFDVKYETRPILSVVQLSQSHGSQVGADHPGNSLGGDQCSSVAAGSSQSEHKYPCPVCLEMFTAAYIESTHLNTHFS